MKPTVTLAIDATTRNAGKQGVMHVRPILFRGDCAANDRFLETPRKGDGSLDR
jgi:hypothetical protein